MTDSNNALAQKPKPPTMGSLKKGIALNRQQAEEQIKTIDPLTVTNRLGLIIDDSGSMGRSGMEDVHKGVRGFTSSCNYQDTSIAIYPLNASAKSLICDYDIINLYVGTLWDTGGTPLWEKLQEMLEKESLTRAVVFSDGVPTDGHFNKEDVEKDIQNPYYTNPKKTLDKYIEKKVVIDTIFIGLEGSSGYKEMKDIAEYTGGTFVHFKDSFTLGTSLKYLSPRYRALLANEELKVKIERGEQI